LTRPITTARAGPWTTAERFLPPSVFAVSLAVAILIVVVPASTALAPPVSVGITTVLIATAILATIPARIELGIHSVLVVSTSEVAAGGLRGRSTIITTPAALLKSLLAM